MKEMHRIIALHAIAIEFRALDVLV
jgi:hypothetical protein